MALSIAEPNVKSQNPGIGEGSQIPIALPSLQRNNTFRGDRKRVVKHPHENRLGFLFPIMNQLYISI